jgi:DNA-binding PadR family transcriptional regulator
MSDDMQFRKEEARVEVLRFLAERDRLAHSPDAIRRGVNREGFDFKKDEILSALELLSGLGLVIARIESLGASKYYQATAQGVLEHERKA